VAPVEREDPPLALGKSCG